VGEWQAWVRSTGEAGQQEQAPRPEEPMGSEERARTLSLIDFLADYDARRNPPVYDIRKYDLFLLRDADLPDVPGVSLTPAADAWLTVEFLDLPPKPEVPEELVPLLGDSAGISPHVRPEIRVPAEDAGSGEPAGDLDPVLVADAEEWVTSVWEPFAARWVQVSAAKTLHRDLFQQREYLATDRESLELVWGFGRLRWQRDGIVIDHPLVTIPVEVEQDDDTQRIRVIPAGAPEVEARCLAGLSLADRARYMSIRQSVNDSGMDLWDEQGLQHLLQQLIRAVDHEGTLAGQAPPPGDAAVADGSWVLYMRRRLPDYQGFLEQMRELYRDESVAVPDTLQAIVTDAPSVLAERSAAAAGRVAADEERGAAADPRPRAAEHRRHGAGTAGNRQVTHNCEHHQPLRRLRETGPGGGRERAGPAFPDGQDPRRNQRPDSGGPGRGRRQPPRDGVGDRADPDPGHRDRPPLRRRTDPRAHR
jgi:hypothetical protein